MLKKRQQKDKENEKIKDGEPKGISGLVNLGNSCYLNSILQCLLHLPELIIYMNSQKLNDDLEYNKSINKNLSNKAKEKQDLHYKLVKEFEKLIKEIWKGFPILDLLKTKNNHEIKNMESLEEKPNPNNNIIINNNTKYNLEPREFKDILSEAFPQFDGKLQHDAHEVLTRILESFHLALNKSFNEGGLLITSEISDYNLLARKTLSFIEDAKHRAVNDSFIEDNFYGQLSSIFICYKCHKQIGETYEPFSSLELTIPIEKNINIYILPLNPSNFEQSKLNITINDNMSYEDIYNQISKTNGYNFGNYIIYWPNEIKKKNENRKTRSLRTKKIANNDYNNLFGTCENEDIIINENNIDKCQNFINFKTNELIMMENYDINFFIKSNIHETPYYEYFLEIRLLKNNKNSSNYNIQENIPRIFKVYILENGDEHLIYNYIYKYLELFTENGKIKKNLGKSQNNNGNINISVNKKLNVSSSFENKIKNKNKKCNSKKEAQKKIIEDNNDFINNNNNNYISLEEEEKKEIYYDKKYILGVICKNLSKENNNNNIIEVVCPLCNKKIKKIKNGYCECFCINDLFDNELNIKNKELKNQFSAKLINFIENNTSSHNSLLSIIIHPYQNSNFSFLNFNKFTMYNIIPNIPKNNKKKASCKHNLLDLFESFAAEEKIDNMSRCDNCGDITYTYQKKDIHKFPQILIIHIKRFKNEIEKNEEKIEFPEEIDLSKYNNKGNVGLYSLNSAVFHQGTLIKGHYTSIVKYIPNNKWLFCNDTKTKFLTGDKIMGLNPSYNRDNITSIGDGYILFYRKNTE